MNLEGDLPTQTTPSKSLKPLVIVAAVLIIAVLAGTSGYFLGRSSPFSPLNQPPLTQKSFKLDGSQSPSPIPTSASSLRNVPDKVAPDWPTYTSIFEGNHRFSIRYPPHWAFFEWKHNSGYHVPVLNKLYPEKIVDFGNPAMLTGAGALYPLVRLSLTTSPDLATISAQQFMGYIQDPIWSDTIVNGLRAKLVYHLTCLSGECFDVILKRYNTVFDLNIPEQGSPQNPAFILMLSTFVID